MHLTVLSPEAVAFHIEGIAACLGPSTVELTLPLNAAKCPELPFAIVAGNQVVLQDGIQLPCRPLQIALGGYLKLLPKVLADPRCQFCRKPADNRMGFAIRILEPRWPRRLPIVCTHDIWLTWKDIQAGWLEKMHIQAPNTLSPFASVLSLNPKCCRPAMRSSEMSSVKTFATLRLTKVLS